MPRLVDRGFDVHCISRSSPPESREATWHRLDLGDHAAAHALLSGLRPTHLLHLAWETAHGSYYTTPDNVRWLEDSLNLVDAFVRSGGRRVVGAGSAAEYDLATSTDLSESSTPLRPNGLYGACKKALSEVIAAYAAVAGIGYAWGRIFFCYGPGEHQSRMVPALLRGLLRGDRIPFQEGRAIRDYVYVEDVAEGFAMLMDLAFEGPVNLGSGEGVGLRDLVERCALACARPGAVDFGSVPTPVYEPARVVADATRARTELGWRPRHPLDVGIRETVAWWRERM